MIRTATLTGVQDDENPYTIQTPPRTEYKDLNTSVKLPVVTMNAVDTYMAPLCVKLEDKAKNLYKERFLIYVRSAAKNNKYHLLAPCATNMKKSVSYCVDVIVDNEGVVDECQCECAVGIGPNAHCKHVQCLLYGLVLFLKSKEFLTSQTCTQKLQTFNKCQTYRGSPMKAESLDIRPEGQGRKLKPMLDFDPRPQKYVKME